MEEEKEGKKEDIENPRNEEKQRLSGSLGQRVTLAAN